MFWPHLQVNMFQKLKVIFKAAAFLLGQTALIRSTCGSTEFTGLIYECAKTGNDALMFSGQLPNALFWFPLGNTCGVVFKQPLFCFVFLSFSGATSAPCLIFIFPAIFYIRIVPKDREPLNSTPKILVRPSPHLPPFMCWLGRCCQTLSTRCACFAPPTLPPPQAACFAALGLSFMVMSLSFIIIDWSTGDGLSARGH